MADVGPGPSGSACLFIALWPGPEVRDALAAWSGQWHWHAAARWVPAERLHLILHFLGDVPRERLPALGEALSVPFAPCPSRHASSVRM
jgi:2'-5' RNA ligase